MRILITSGGTREHIDPVRFISNASSGRMGYELARAALEAGHEVTLITTVIRQVGFAKQLTVVKVVSAAEMFEEVKKHFENCDCLIMAAAVADYRPVKQSKSKIKKESSQLTIQLKPTPDILRWAGKNKNLESHGRLVVGFALEDKNLLKNAERKLAEKNLDMIIANSVSAIDSKESTVHIKRPGRPWETIENKSKAAIAKRVIRLVDSLSPADQA